VNNKRETIKRANREAKTHLGLAFMWVALILPTLLFWSSSILWILMISIYANIVGHWSAYQAAHAEKTGAENP
jgi:hypothetical protein